MNAGPVRIGLTTCPAHVEALDVVKTLLEVNLYLGRVARLAEYFQQVVVGDEVEAREDLSLGLQVHVQGLHDVFQTHVHRVELIQKS